MRFGDHQERVVADHKVRGVWQKGISQKAAFNIVYNSQDMEAT